MATRTIYLTTEGFEKLSRELTELRTVARPRATASIHSASERGDPADNAEWDEAKNQQGFVEGRIRDLELTLPNARVIQRHPDVDLVTLGSRVTVVDDSGARAIYTIVGSVEADPRRGMISNESPVGQALLGKRAGDTATVRAPSGSFDLLVVTIS